MSISFETCVGWAGSVHDARVFINSLLYTKIAEDGILDGAESLTISGKQVPVCLVGDSAYPISTWLMKPFSDNSTLSPQQKHFNYRLSRARAVVEMAFGRLKAQWRRLMKNDMHTEHIPVVISACCILHNMCEIHGDSFNDLWLQEESEYEQPVAPSLPSTSSTANADDLRNTIMDYLYAQQ